MRAKRLRLSRRSRVWVSVAAAAAVAALCSIPGTAAAASSGKPLAKPEPLPPPVTASMSNLPPGMTSHQIVVGDWSDVPAGGGVATAAYCPDGTMATGGGAYNSDGSGRTELSTTMPNTLDGRSVWGIQLNSAVAVRVRPYAICVGGLGNYEIRSISAPIPPGENNARVSLDCNRFSKSTLGGGGSVTPGVGIGNTSLGTSGVYVFQATYANRNPYPETAQVQTYVVCATGVAAAIKAEGYADVLGNDYAPVTATCPAGRILLGGGGWGAWEDDSILTDSFPASANSWTVYFKNPHPYPVKVGATAVCSG